MTTKQIEALHEIAAGNGIVGKNAPNNNTCNALQRKGLIEGRGWAADPYRLTAAGEEVKAKV